MKPNILYIDDEQDLLDLAFSFFEDEGINIDICNDFNLALEKIRQKRYEIIISDVNMPSGNGLELCTIARNEGHFSGKFFVVTGRMEDVTGQDTGSIEVLLKPISFVELVAKVRTFLPK